MIAIIACGSDKVQNISDIVSKLGYDNQIFLMEDLLQKKWLCRKDFDTYDAIIISGSPLTLTTQNRDAYLNLFPFLWDIHVPVLGICFWHQLIGHFFGANYKIWSMIDGPNKIEVMNRKEYLFSWVRRKVFHENHEEEITLPDTFRLLAYSNSCKNEAMKHIDKEIYWVQFHPELSGSAGKKLLENFLNLI